MRSSRNLRSPARQEAALEFRDLQRALQELGEDHRKVLMLVGASGLSHNEAAKVYNCTAGTIRAEFAARARS